MIQLSSQVIHLFKHQGFAIVSTLSKSNTIHCSAKGIVGIEERGAVYLIDLYKANTFNNLSNNPTVTITAIDEHKFTGFTLKGRANIIEREKIQDHIIKKWEEKVIERISNRVLKSIKDEKKSTHQPEALFPQPKYLIEVEVEEIVDLTPTHLK